MRRRGIITGQRDMADRAMFLTLNIAEKRSMVEDLWFLERILQL